MKYLYIILFFLTAGSLDTYAQLQRSTSLPGAPGKGSIVAFPRGIKQSSGEVFYLLATDTAGNINLVPLHGNQHYDSVARPRDPRKPFLKVHGNVIYDYYYQSGVDTPYQQKDIYQHTVQTYLDFTIRDQYPVRVGFTTARGNSTLFRNITGLNMQYTSSDFKSLLWEKLQKWDVSRYTKMQDLQYEKRSLDAEAFKLNQLRVDIDGPAAIQRRVEAKERALYGKKPNLNLDTLPHPNLNLVLKNKPRLKLSSDSSLEDEYAAKRRQIDSLEKRVKKLDSLYRLHQSQIGDVNGSLLSKLMASRNNEELTATLKEMNLPDTVLPKGYKTLLAIRTIALGRTLVDYSELTAKNISIQGGQVEYNPSWYAAVATGVIDYRFRNYVVNNDGPKQYLSLFKAGYGMKEGNHVYFTYYMGKRQLYNQHTDSAGSRYPDYNIIGIALEGRWQLTKNLFLTGEVAKSSLPYYQAAKDESKAQSLLKFSDRRNEAWSIAANAFIPATKTKLTGTYKLLGAGFQSFSLYTTGSKQIAWNVRIDQPFFRQQLLVTAAIRKNDYTSQFQQANYNSNTIFKTLQATLRIKNYPVVSIGYYPSSQLTKLTEGALVENTFYTLVGTVSHFYKVKRITMNSMLSYTRFYNKMTDSSFVYFNTKNILLNHSMFLGRFTIQGTGSAALNSDYNLYGADGNVQYQVRTWLDIGGGVKYSYQTVYELRQVGYTANFRVNIPYFGQVEMMADKGFIPGAQRRLVSNNTGRITFTKIF
ncbi:hypothetical protein [Chitinophaga sancti]|uniref:Uncharacterized protein n=1 Tax=Chitinophaga sancti TaxID=1004 RepID=A0A1K1SD27_9BACT|nr:hypothetical protein [Chitinophaga sancti]WQD63607.1 hypothetical protein U0033_04310 [Chitinophaga sancti]WQG90768.1 hypothetical protein SR876_04610 [Chitinophaga sancti]SFW82012.1 hypothetical protein SAMN05661012_05180 [Chitinophaga sancti]